MYRSIIEEYVDLLIASRLNDVPALEQILKKVKFTTKMLSEAAVMVSLRRRRFESLNILVQAGADLNYKGYMGKTCLDFATQNNVKGLLEILEELKVEGATRIVERSDNEKNFVLAVKKGDLPSVNHFLSQGTCPNLVDRHNDSLLMNAAHRGFFEVCVLLLNYGADINYKNGGSTVYTVVSNHYLEEYLKQDEESVGFRKELEYQKDRIKSLLIEHSPSIAGDDVEDDYEYLEDDDLDRAEFDAILAKICITKKAEWIERKKQSFLPI